MHIATLRKHQDQQDRELAKAWFSYIPLLTFTLVHFPYIAIASSVLDFAKSRSSNRLEGVVGGETSSKTAPVGWAAGSDIRGREARRVPISKVWPAGT
ncbi:hypothetical protein EV426DRAFT_716399 [Tirmania nivea]|nr:hypothetical protein EV426DRAFT_716399 [Tirmania nivea]